MRRMVATSSFWALFGYGSSLALRFVSNIILWRILAPEDFGVMNLVNPVLLSLQMFSDLGISQNVIQSPRGDEPRFLDTAWTLQVLRGAALTALACLLAWPAARFYDVPTLVPLICAAGATALLQGFGSMQLFTVTRQMQLRGRTLIELVSQVIGFAVTLFWAWHSRSAWPLVGGQLAYAAVRTLLSRYALDGRRDRFAWDRDSLGTLTRFGMWIFLSTLLIFVANQSDRLIFGKLVSLALLGIYGLAQGYAVMPGGLLGHMILSIALPALSRVRNAGQPFLPAFQKIRVPIVLGAGGFAAALIAAGQLLILGLFPPHAADAGWMLQLLSLGAVFGVLENLNTTALLALGEPKWSALANLAKVAGIVVLIPLGWSLYDFPGAIAGFAAADVLKYAIAVVGAARHGIALIANDLLLLAAVAVTAAFGYALAPYALETSRRYLGELLSHLPKGDALTVLVAAGAVGGMEAALWGGALLTWLLRSRRAPAPVESAAL
jgi:O-antigen/teichoic acid export membrane protein